MSAMVRFVSISVVEPPPSRLIAFAVAKGVSKSAQRSFEEKIEQCAGQRDKLNIDVPLTLILDDQQCLHVMLTQVPNSDGVCLVAGVSDSSFRNGTLVRKLLRRISNDMFKRNSADTILSASQKGIFHRENRGALSGVVSDFSEVVQVDKMAAIQVDIDKAKGVMQKNIELAIESTEKLDQMEDRSNKLVQEGAKFDKQSKVLKRMMCRRYAKYTILLLLLVGVGIAVLVSLFK